VTGTIGKKSVANAAEQTIVAQSKESVSDKKAAVQTNVVMTTDKTQTTESVSENKETSGKQPAEVPVNMDVEKGDQQNADKGSSPWKLDPVFVSQVFVSLKISPEGIQGDYPVKTEELKIAKSTDEDAAVEVNSSKTNINKVYLKRLVKQDKTGIWTVVGYDSAS
jgi:hypothetical protein